MKTFYLLACVLGLLATSVAQAEPRVPSRPECIKRIESCEAILREFQENPATRIPSDVLARARALVITNQFKAGFIFGVKDGYGIMMVKRANGEWSVPALLTAGEASLGLQAGARTVETVLVFNDDQTPRLIFDQRFNVGVDAVAVAGPKDVERNRTNEEVLRAPVLVYTKSRGLFAGATVKTGFISRDDAANRIFYNTTYTLPEILYSDWITPPTEVVPLMQFVQSIAK